MKRIFVGAVFAATGLLIGVLMGALFADFGGNASESITFGLIFGSIPIAIGVLVVRSGLGSKRATTVAIQTAHRSLRAEVISSQDVATQIATARAALASRRTADALNALSEAVGIALLEESAEDLEAVRNLLRSVPARLGSKTLANLEQSINQVPIPAGTALTVESRARERLRKCECSAALCHSVPTVIGP